MKQQDEVSKEVQAALSEVMKTPESKAYEDEFGIVDLPDQLQGPVLKEALGEANYNALKSQAPDFLERHTTDDRTPDQARQQMIDRMTGRCPDRLPRGYDPLSGNDR